MKLRAFLIAGALLASGHVVRAQDLSVTIIDHGIYTSEIVTRDSGERGANKIAKLRNICHIQTTTVIPNRDHLQFGFQYWIDGPPMGSTVPLVMRIRLPDHTKPEGQPQIYVVNQRGLSAPVGRMNYEGWINWLTRPGTWTFDILHKDRRLAGMSFTLVDKADVKVKPDGESTCFLSS